MLNLAKMSEPIQHRHCQVSHFAVFTGTLVAVGFLAFLRLAFPRNFLRFRLKSLRFARNSCALQNPCFLLEILALFKILAFCPKFLRSRNSCVLGDILVLFKIHAFQRKFAKLYSKLLRPSNFLHFAQNYCSLQNPCVSAEILAFWGNYCFRQISCVFLRIIAPFKMLAFQQEFLRP